MAELLATVKDIDSVDESLRDFYTEDGNGNFVLNLGDAKSHPLYQTLKRTADNLDKAKKTAETALAAANAKLAAVPEDFDADKWAQWKAEAEGAENDPDRKDVNKRIESAVQAARQQEQARAAASLKKVEEQRDALKAENDGLVAWRAKQIKDRALNEALEAAGVTNPARRRGAKALLSDDVEVIEEDGEFVARMKASLGGDDVARYVQTWASTDDGKAFVDPAKGADANGGDRRQRDASDNPFGKANWNKTAQGQLIRTDRAKAERLAKQAGFRDLTAASSAMGPIAA